MGHRDVAPDEFKRRAESLGLELQAVTVNREAAEQIPAKSGDNTVEGRLPTEKDVIIDNDKLEETIMNMGNVGTERENLGGSKTDPSVEIWNKAATDMASSVKEAAGYMKDVSNNTSRVASDIAALKEELKEQKKLGKRLETAAIAVGTIAAGTALGFGVVTFIQSRKAKNALPLPVHEVGTPGQPVRTQVQK